MPKSKKTATKTPQQLANDETMKIFRMTSIFIEEPELVEFIRYSVFDGLTEEGIYDYVSNFCQLLPRQSKLNQLTFSVVHRFCLVLVDDLWPNRALRYSIGPWVARYGELQIWNRCGGHERLLISPGTSIRKNKASANFLVDTYTDKPFDPVEVNTWNAPHHVLNALLSNTDVDLVSRLLM